MPCRRGVAEERRLEMGTGWIRLHRQLLDSPDYFCEQFDRVHCWIDLLLMAEIKPRNLRVRGRLVQLDRGDIAISLDKLRERWRFGSKHTVIARLREFQDDGRITIRRENTVNVISIVHYRKYQDYQEVSTDFEEDTALQTAPQSALQTAPQSAPQSALLLKNLKNKQVNNISNTLSGACVCAREGEPPDEYSEFLAGKTWQTEVKMVDSLMHGKYLEGCCMRYGIERERARELLGEFHEDCKLKLHTHDTLKDLMSHFISWVNIKFEKDGRTKERAPEDRRRGYEAGNAQAEDFASAF